MTSFKVFPIFALSPIHNIPVLMGFSLSLLLARQKMQKMKKKYEATCKARGDKSFWHWRVPNAKVKLTPGMLDLLP